MSKDVSIFGISRFRPLRCRVVYKYPYNLYEFLTIPS